MVDMDGLDDSPDREPLSWRVRRWAAPMAMAAAVVMSIAAVQLLADDQDPFTTPRSGDQRPRFMLTVQRMADARQDEGPAPWFEVLAFQPDGRPRLVGSVERPPSAGEAQTILAGPKRTFIVAATRKKPCESRFYRGELGADGKVRSIKPFHHGAVPALVAGLALSLDGDRLAYTTAPCTRDGERPPEPRANVTVLDIDSGHRRTWTTATPSVIGQIVWAQDGRTLGYTIGDVHIGSVPGAEVQPGQALQPDMPVESKIQGVTVHALDTDEPGTDVRAGRVLFRQSDDSLITSAVMNPDGRTGYGVMKKKESSSTVIFSFSEGRPMRVTSTIPRKPNVASAVVLGSDEPLYACLNGLDSFGRVIEGGFSANLSRSGGCGADYIF